MHLISGVNYCCENLNEGGNVLEGSIVDFSHKGAFRLSEANQIVGILNRITKKHGTTVNNLISRLENSQDDDQSKTTHIENQISKEIESWNVKVRKLGAVPKGMWRVDIDSGDGYFCWSYPESKINFWHDYKSGHSNRVALNELKYSGDHTLKNYGEVKNSDIY